MNTIDQIAWESVEKEIQKAVQKAVEFHSETISKILQEEITEEYIKEIVEDHMKYSDTVNNLITKLAKPHVESQIRKIFQSKDKKHEEMQ